MGWEHLLLMGVVGWEKLCANVRMGWRQLSGQCGGKFGNARYGGTGNSRDGKKMPYVGTVDVSDHHCA